MAYFECRTKAALIAELTPTDEPDTVFELYRKYRAVAQTALEQATRRKVIEFNELPYVLPTGKQGYLIDSRSTFIDCTRLEPLLNKKTTHGSRSSPVSPILFCPFDRLQPWHTTVLYFAAAAIEHAAGIAPVAGYVCFSHALEIKSVRLGASDQHLSALREMATRRRARPQTIQLNAHCPTCQYRTRCYKKAIDDDSLSLVTSIPPKERRKLEAKGITTITQLSYTYRPRRKRQLRATPRPLNTLVTNKNDSRLKALAIRKKQVHILHADPVAVEGTPVYFDVEGMPGSDYYYLVGMRFKMGDHWIERSYWADTRTEESDVWRQCLKTLLTIENPQLVHYGSYESTYIARMRQRYPNTIRNKRQLNAVLDGSRNLLKSIYASIYFPTFTNGLKDVASYLGFNWSDPTLTGSRAAVFRRQWEIEPSEATKGMLVRYNIEDCRAAQIVADAVDGFQHQVQQGAFSTPNLVDINSLKVPYQRTYGPFASPSPDFHRINKAAYWNYQRERVFVRPAKQLAATKIASRNAKRGRRPPRPDKVVYVERAPPARCPKCRRRRIWKAGCQTQTVVDLVFTRKGARRSIVRQKI